MKNNDAVEERKGRGFSQVSVGIIVISGVIISLFCLLLLAHLLQPVVLSCCKQSFPYKHALFAGRGSPLVDNISSLRATCCLREPLAGDSWRRCNCAWRVHLSAPRNPTGVDCRESVRRMNRMSDSWPTDCVLARGLANKYRAYIPKRQQQQL